jgi:S-disulfanyl-L-cysteine oxidoreductase SoxD
MSSWVERAMQGLSALLALRATQAVRALQVLQAVRIGASSLLVLAAVGAAAASERYPGIGRPATPKEIAAWDIDVRPDFKGLPPGSGSVAQGQKVWEAQCASCHGVFGESNEVFAPLIGGTTAEDVKAGRVRHLSQPGYPQRTTMMKLARLSTLWDYIRRAMPWNAPKSLSVDEVYAVTAYVLNLGGVVADDFTLSDRNIAAVQARLPNRDGLATDHAMWPGRALTGAAGKPDVSARACMTNCAVEPRVASLLPDHARDAHGNLAQQNRGVGPQRGADTSRPGAPVAAVVAPAGGAGAAAGAGAGAGAGALALAQKHSCTACHGVDSKIVGPAFRDIAGRYGSRGDAVAYLAQKIQQGGAGAWGAVPMPPQAVSADDAQVLGRWLADGARR